jgi:predicted MPP superfamily phosphohydrolase
MVNDLNPDLIALAGDFVSMPIFDDEERKAALAAEPCASLLHQLRSTHGSWAVLGNHDYYTDPAHVTAALKAEGIRVLANESAPIETNGVRIWLAGVNDVTGGTADLGKTLRGTPADEATR